MAQRQEPVTASPPHDPSVQTSQGMGCSGPPKLPSGPLCRDQGTEDPEEASGAGTHFPSWSDLKAVSLLLAPRPQPLRPQKWPCGVWMGELCWEAAAPLEGSCLQKRGHS